jgi:tetratricopeptide (TPR) repeat protein
LLKTQIISFCTDLFTFKKRDPAAQKKELSYNLLLPYKLELTLKNDVMDQDHFTSLLSQSAPSEARSDPLQDVSRAVELHLVQAETALLNADIAEALHHFDKAALLDPENPKVYLSQGLALFEAGSHEGKEYLLPKASKQFKRAAHLNPHHFDTWHTWGSLLYFMGTQLGEYHYFTQAHEKLLRASKLSLNQSPETLCELYWDRGAVLSKIAARSGEPCDALEALTLFEKASALEENLPAEFWIDKANTYLTLSAQISDTYPLSQAILCAKKASQLEEDPTESTRILITAYTGLYLKTHDEDDFTQATHYYTAAYTKKPKDVDLWLSWAQFLCKAARIASGAKRLQLAIDRCQGAHLLDADHPLILSTWVEALALLGKETDNLDLILTAEDKISSATNEEPSDPDILYSWGLCLHAMGDYFDELDYYYQAIEQFQAGLSLDRTQHRLWHALGCTYSLLGDIEGSDHSFALALRFLEKALALSDSTEYLFDYATTLSKVSELFAKIEYAEKAGLEFERLLHLQKNAVYLHPHWLFRYALNLDLLGNFHEEASYYERAIDMFSHILMIDPDFPKAQHHIALALSHLGDLNSDTAPLTQALHHYRLALNNEEENDPVLLDWATTLINLGCHTYDSTQTDALYREAYAKLSEALRLGNPHAYYPLSCLHSLIGACEKSMEYLLQAHKNKALPPLDELLEDEWLDNLRSTSLFQEFIHHIEKRPISPEES